MEKYELVKENGSAELETYKHTHTHTPHTETQTHTHTYKHTHNNTHTNTHTTHTHNNTHTITHTHTHTFFLRYDPVCCELQNNANHHQETLKSVAPHCGRVTQTRCKNNFPAES